MRAWVGIIGAGLLVGAAAPTAQAAGKPRDACFQPESGPDETIAACAVVLGQRKRETTTSIAHALYNRGLAYVKKGDLDRGIGDFSEAIRVDPSDPDTFRERGSAYDDKEEYDRALADYEQSIKLDPKNGTTWAYRGITYGNRGEPDEAIRSFDRAIELDPARGLTFYSRALAYEKKADFARALADIETAAHLSPDDEDVQGVLKRVRALAQAKPAQGGPVVPAAQPASAGAATPADLAAQEAATAAVWERVPFAARNAMFVTRAADAYGDYAPRPSNAFKPGEKLLSYIEPIAYTWTPQGDTLRFGVVVDFELLTRDGKVLGGQKGILRQEFATHCRNREFFLNSTMSVDGAPAGDYVLAYVLHDLGSERTARVEQPFSITAGGAPAR